MLGALFVRTPQRGLAPGLRGFPLTLPSPRKRGEGIDTLSPLELLLTLR